MKPVDDPAALSGKIAGSGSMLAVANTGQTTLLALVYKLKGANIQAVEKPFDAGDRHFAAGSLLISGVSDDSLASALHDLSLDAVRLSVTPTVPAHSVTAPRIAFMHTWLATQTEGWWRYAFDTAGVPYDYNTTQTVAKQDDLHTKYDVIVFAPVSRVSAQDIISGTPNWTTRCRGRRRDLTPNLGLDSTDDIRPGLGYEGLAHLKTFVEEGGLLHHLRRYGAVRHRNGLALDDIVSAGEARVVGSILNTAFVARTIPWPMDTT